MNVCKNGPNEAKTDPLAPLHVSLNGLAVDIVACHLPRGSKLQWREDIGEELPSARESRVG